MAWRDIIHKMMGGQSFELARAWEWAISNQLIYPDPDNEIDNRNPINLDDLILILYRLQHPNP